MFSYSIRLFPIILFFFIQLKGNAQSIDFNNYQPLKCEGTPPEEFLKPSYKKYYNDVTELKKNKNVTKNDKKLQKELSFITNYKIDDILMSGKVLYGNKVSNYINTVANKLLENESKLKKKMRFFLLDVPYANALSTNNGIIFVTTGLLAQLENEAQLAFVLSHEISHFKLNHSFESFKKTKDIIKGNKYDDMGTDEKILKILKYSKENEADADVEGLELYTAAGYDQNEALKMMDILLYSYLPFDDIAFPRTFFNDSFYKIPSTYMLDSAKEIVAQEDEDDEKSSHPNTEFRKMNLEKYINDKAKGKIFFLGQEAFEEVLKISRYELGYLYILKGNYTKAFYHAFLLNQIYGESAYTSELMVAALYGVNKDKLASDDEDDDDDENIDDEGQISLVSSLFNSMHSDEFNILAAKTIHNIYQKYPTKYTNNVMKDVFVDLFYSHKYMKSSFNKEVVLIDEQPIKKDTIETEEKDLSKETHSKVRKIIKKKKQKEVTTNSKYYKNAFVTNYKINSFKTFIDSIDNEVEELKKREEDYGISQLRKNPYRRYQQSILDEQENQRKNGKRLGIDSIIMIAPSYSAVFNKGDNVKVNNLDDELKAIEITKYLKANGNAQNLNMNLIDINQRVSLNSDQLNEYALISNWISEKYKHTDKNDLLFSQKYMDKLIANTGYSNVGFAGFTYENSSHNVSGIAFVLSAIAYPTLPFTIYYAIDHDKRLNYYYIIYDLKTGEQKLIIINTIRRRPKPKVIDLHIAYSLFQTKTKAKKK